jgi:WD40 repeat protein
MGDNTPSIKPHCVDTFDLVVSDDQAKTVVNWSSFSNSGKEFAIHYSVIGEQAIRSKPLIAIRDLSLKTWRDPVQAGPPSPSLGFGKPAAYSKPGGEFVVATETGIQVHSDRKEAEPQVLRLKRLSATISVFHPSLWLHSDGKSLSRALFSVREGEVQIDRCDFGPPLKLRDTTRYRVPKATSLALSHDLRLMAWTPGEGEFIALNIVNITDGRTRKLTARKPIGEVTTTAFSPAGQHIACGCADGSFALWDLQGTAKGMVMRVASKSVSTIAFRNDGEVVSFGSYDANDEHNVWLFSLKMMKVLASWSDNRWGVEHITFDKSGSRLAVSSSKRTNIYKLMQ